MKKQKPNGHALAMAEAFQGMIHDAVKPMIDGLQGEMRQMEGRLNGRIDTTDQNIQAQLSTHRKDIAADVRRALKGKL